MRLLCDENIKQTIYNLLRQEGHDVIRVQDEFDQATPDDELVQFCREEGRVLLTNDEDFFSFETHAGVLYLTEQTASPRAVATAVQKIEQYVGEDELAERVLHVPDGWT